MVYVLPEGPALRLYIPECFFWPHQKAHHWTETIDIRRCYEDKCVLYSLLALEAPAEFIVQRVASAPHISGKDDYFGPIYLA